MKSTKDQVVEHLRECAQEIEDGEVHVTQFEVDGVGMKYMLKITMEEAETAH